MSPIVSSVQNAHVAAARALLTRKGRTAASAYLVEGPHAVAELVASPDQTLGELFVTDTAADREIVLMRRVAASGVPIRVVTDRVLASLGDTVTPQGMVAVAASRFASLDRILATSPSLLAALVGVSDPGNAGAAIRTADAAGADAVVLSAGSVDVRTGKVVRATAGSLFHLPVATDVEATTAVTAIRAAGLTVLASSAHGDADLDELADDGLLATPTAWLFGNEAHGLAADVEALADARVRVPIHGRAESLNLAATVAVCLYASARAHRRRPRPT